VPATRAIAMGLKSDLLVRHRIDSCQIQVLDALATSCSALFCLPVVTVDDEREAIIMLTISRGWIFDGDYRTRGGECAMRA